jgi:hypothetical protein
MCVSFTTLAKATTAFSKGLHYMGIGAISCGQSEMILPNAVGNFQKGERCVVIPHSQASSDCPCRYSNMNYIFGVALWALQALIIIISYDIACQWFINLANRMKMHWPEKIQPLSGLILHPLIPKLYEPAHQRKGHAPYSFNLSAGMGMTDGECPERIWSAHNALGNATKT